MITKFTLFCLLENIHKAFVAKNIRVSDVLSDSRVHPKNIPETSQIIADEISIYKGEDLHLLRILNDQIRYQIEGDLMGIAILLNELLPGRLDYRNMPCPQSRQQVTTNKPEELLAILSKESEDFISYIIRISLRCDDFYCKLPVNDFRSTIQELEELSEKWLTGIPMETESALVRSLAIVDERGASLHRFRSNAPHATPKLTLIYDIIPLMHNLARYNRRHSQPFNRFVNGAITLLVNTIGANFDDIGTQKDGLDQEQIDVAMDMITEFTQLGGQLKANSDAAQQLLQRFHHGHVVYADMLALLRVQHNLMVGLFTDVMRRFANAIIDLVPVAVNPEAWIQFLTDSRILVCYAQQQNVEDAVN